MTPREFSIAAPLLALAILFGVYPQALFHYMTPSVDRTVDDLAAWTAGERAGRPGACPRANGRAFDPPPRRPSSVIVPSRTSYQQKQPRP